MSRQHDEDERVYDRQQAVDQAVEWRARVHLNEPFDHNQALEVISVAEVFYRWALTGRHRDFLLLTASNLRPLSHPRHLEGQHPMANPQVPIGYQFDLTVNPTDVLGNPVSDTLTWTDSDSSGTTTLTVDDATTLKVTVACPGPNVLGGVIITVVDADGVTGTYTFDVVADVATAFTFAASTPVKIAPAPTA